MAILFCWHKSDTTQKDHVWDLRQASCEDYGRLKKKNQERIQAALGEQVYPQNSNGPTFTCHVERGKWSYRLNSYPLPQNSREHS